MLIEKADRSDAGRASVVEGANSLVDQSNPQEITGNEQATVQQGAVASDMTQPSLERVSRLDRLGDGRGEAIVQSLTTILAAMEERILEAFERKLAFDSGKEKQIERLHAELQGYKGDLVAKAIRPIFQSLIRLHDDVGKMLEALTQEDPARLTPARLVGLLKDFQEDVELALQDNGVTAFRTTGDDFDPRRQRVLRTVHTMEPPEVGRLAERLRPGFETDQTLLEKERVAVYVLARQDPVTDQEPQK
jgi:molecular chaperone GrpE (heat shock protein)